MLNQASMGCLPEALLQIWNKILLHIRHACGSYWLGESQVSWSILSNRSYSYSYCQMLIVTGGNDGQLDVETTEVMDYEARGTWRSWWRWPTMSNFFYDGPVNDGAVAIKGWWWRFSENLPAATFGLAGVNLAGVFHVTGGWQVGQLNKSYYFSIYFLMKILFGVKISHIWIAILCICDHWSVICNCVTNFHFPFENRRK